MQKLQCFWNTFYMSWLIRLLSKNDERFLQLVSYLKSFVSRKKRITRTTERWKRAIGMSVNVPMYWFLCTELQNLSQIFSFMNYRYELPIGISDVLVKISTIEKNTISMNNSIVLNSRYNFFSITPLSFFGRLILRSLGKTFQFEYLNRKEWKYLAVSKLKC